jgi:hypothetical protein
MRPAALKRRAKRMLRQHRDTMTQPQIEAVEKALKDPALMQQWGDKIREARLDPPPENMLQGIAWDKVWDWFKANWPTILKLLMSLLVLI